MIRYPNQSIEKPADTQPGEKEKKNDGGKSQSETDEGKTTL
jgi:hypothetical protein